MMESIYVSTPVVNTYLIGFAIDVYSFKRR